MSNTDIIAQTLEIDPLIPTRKQLKAIKSNDEYEVAQQNLQQILDVGINAVGELADIASTSQDPRVYRVLSELISTMTTASKEVIETKHREIETQVKQKQLDRDVQPQTINQNLFVGSTDDALKLLQNSNKSEEQHEKTS